MSDELWDATEGEDDERMPRVLRRAAADLRRDAPTDERAVAAVMAAVRQRPVPRRPTAWHRLTAARTWQLSPLAAAGLAASLVAVGALGAWSALDFRRDAGPGNTPALASSAPTGTTAPGTAGAAVVGRGDVAPTHVVRFVLAAPNVSRVTLVGDFNGWDADATPMRWDAAARAWTTVVELPAGRYVYAFVLDGRRWVADPSAPLAPEDGFGASNSVVVVEPSIGGAT